MNWKPRLVRTLSTEREVVAALGPRLVGIGMSTVDSRSARVIARRGIDEVHFGSRAIAWLDRAHRRGQVMSPEGKLLCWIRDGEAVPGLAPVPAGFARAFRAFAQGGAPTPPAESLTARRVREVGSAAEAAALPAIERAQLTAAARELCGRTGLRALLAEATRREDVLVAVELAAGKTPRLTAWLWSTLDDGVFFDAGERTPNGLAISQRAVHDMTSDRAGLVAAVQAAWKRLGRRR